MNKIEELSCQLGTVLAKLNWTITTAESCTGGGIASAITEVAGSSGYFNQAFVTYSNEAKTVLVDVPEMVIKQHGAVSRKTVEAMALGAATKAKAELAISVSGIAGPSGGTGDKPVGTVWIAIYCAKEAKNTVWSQCFQFKGDRKGIREKAIETSITKALEISKKFI